MLSVSELTYRIKDLLENNFKSIEVEGEIFGNFKPHYSGHYYFTIKDNKASLDAIIWKSTALRLQLDFKTGDKVILKGRLNLYEKQGKYQIIVNSISKKGVGNLFLEFEKMKNKLQREGLFDFIPKKLPFIPKKTVLLTAKDAAALTDFLKIAQKRYPYANIVIVPTPVQGKDAGVRIAENIEFAQKIKDADLMVLTRGGGSIEDLWPFNEEIVARAISKSKLPVVTAIGHERDFTIADFVADKRAATPSEAAELIYPEYEELKEKLKIIEAKLLYSVVNKIKNSELKLINIKQKLQNKSLFISKFEEEKEDLKDKLITAINLKLSENWEKLQFYKEYFLKNDPKNNLLNKKHELELIKRNLIQIIKEKINEEQKETDNLKLKLQLLSPFKLLEKGYTLIKDKDGKPLTSIKNIKKGDEIKVVFKDGEISADVK